jgi:hypothetical protein
MKKDRVANFHGQASDAYDKHKHQKFAHEN